MTGPREAPTPQQFRASDNAFFNIYYNATFVVLDFSVYIPFIFNYKFPLSETNSNFLLGLGVSMLFNIPTNETIYEFGNETLDNIYKTT